MRRFICHPLQLIALFWVALVCLEFGWIHALFPLEDRLNDKLIRIQSKNLQPDPDVVIIDIDEPSMNDMSTIAGRWPWLREIHADLVEGLLEFEPKAIVFDIMFPEPDTKHPKSDARLSSVIGSHPYIYLPMVRLNAQDDPGGVKIKNFTDAISAQARPGVDSEAKIALQLPYAIAKKSWRLGTINSDTDSDGIVRRYRLFTEAYGWYIPSLPARVVEGLGKKIPYQETITLGWRSANNYPRYSYSQLYKTLTEMRPNLNNEDLKKLNDLFHNKIVIIGSTASGLFDHHVTPLGAAYAGVDILATTIDNLKNDNYLRPSSHYIPFVLSLLLVASLWLAFVKRLNPLRIAGIGLPISGLIISVAYFSLNRLILLPILAPLIFGWACFFSLALYEYLHERRTREKTVRIFNRFLDPRVVKDLVAQGETTETVSGQTKQITILFSDIRGFTTLSETKSPQEIVNLLNRYFSRQVDVVFRHGGTLDKFIGDAIMAFWGAPHEDNQHAEHAISAALEMSDQLIKFKEELGTLGETFDVGIGIHSGPAVVGFIGSEHRLEYTAIGDTVNLASRIEGLTKGVARILVSAETMQTCKQSFDFIDHGSYKVKGREQEVRLFEPRRKS